jgi:hypothetical protein
MGDAGYFALNINSLTKGNYVKTNLDAAVVDTVGENNNIIVFDLSSYLMYNTATDVQVRMDFYQGTSGTASPTGTVKIDWIRSYALKEDITDIPTVINSVKAENTFRYFSENGILHIFADKTQNIDIYGMDGRLYGKFALSEGENSVTLLKGVYIVNKQKVIIK